MAMRRGFLPASIVLMFLVLIPVASARDSTSDGSGGQALRRFGLFVGANDGGAGRTRLLYAVSDSRSMADVMYEVGGVERADSIVAVDPTPRELSDKLAQMRSLIATRKAQAGRGESLRTEFILYYSGHSDEQGLLLGGKRFNYRDLHDALRDMDVDVGIAVLDSCDSGAFIRLKGGQRVSPFLVDESAKMKGQVFLTSSSEDEASQESDAIGGSFFTQSLISGLRGAADFSRDGRVTIDEAYQFARSETTARTENSAAGPQHPAWHIELTGTGDLVLTDIRSPSAGLIISEDVEGRLAVRDAAGKLAVEIHKAVGSSLQLALPPGNYTVSAGTTTRYLEASVRLRAGDWSEVRRRDFVGTDRLSSRSRGDQADSVPADPAADEFLAQDWGLADDAKVLENTVNRYLRRVTPPGPNAAASAANASRDEGLSPDAAGSSVGGSGLPDSAGSESPSAEPPGNPSSHAQTLEERGDAAHPFVPVSVSFVPGIGFPPPAFGAVKGVSFNLLVGESYAVHGAEFGSVLNISTHDLDGVQFAGVGNIVGGPARWVQAAGVFNIASGDLAGVQAAGVFNVAAGAVRGGQLGLVNIAGTMNGVQLGLVNIASKMDGLALGLVNISGNGFMSASGFSDASGMYYLDFQSGGRLYTVLFSGWNRPPDAGYSLVAYGAGLGLHVDLGPFFAELDGSAKTVFAAASGVSVDQTQLTPFFSLRTKIGALLFRRVGGFLGCTFDFSFPGEVPNSFAHSGTVWKISIAAGTIGIYPKFTTGLTLRL
ncbi:MAG TPA: caspase family protein [Spirochaetia bacterium]|nr:caspase family protein [Spirochaetia bacterium]